MFTISLSALHTAIGGLAKIIATKVTLPVLGAIRISASHGLVTLTGTDLEQHLSYTTEATATESADLLVDFKGLREFVKAAGKTGNAVIEPLENNQIRIRPENGSPGLARTLSGFPLIEFPAHPPCSGNPVKIGTEFFTRLRDAIPSASKDPTRRTVNGVLVEPDQMIATDGKHLLRLSGSTGLSAPVILPATKVLANGVLAQEGTVTVDIGKDSTWCRFSCGDWSYAVRAIEGPFPNYRQIMPNATSEEISFTEEDVRELVHLLPRMPRCSEHNGMHLHATGTAVHVLSEVLDNPATPTLAKFAGKGTEHTLTINRSYLIRGFQFGFRNLAFNDSRSPLLLHGSDKSSSLLFMPLKGDVDQEKLAKALGKGSDRINRIDKMEEKSVTEPATSPVEDETMPEPEAEAVVPSETPVTSDQHPVTSDSKPASIDPHPITNQEEPSMTESTKPETTVTKPQFQVVGEEQDPFAELLSAISETQEQAKQTLEKTGKLAKLVRETQRAVKLKEREFSKTQRLIADLKKVSGF